MKTIRILIFLWFVSVFLFGQRSSADTQQRVRWVEDGDTVVLVDGRHVRYIGINAPEIDHDDQKAEPYGYEAKRLNQKIVLFKNIRLEFDREKNDQYRRFLAYVFLEDGTFVNQEMIKRGYAYCLPRKPNDHYDRILLAAQRQAMSEGLGIWNQWKEKPLRYIGNRNSRRFHVETCPFGKNISKRNRIVFSNKWEAFWAGYAPCKKCR